MFHILSYAAYLACPLMMLFCMKGMFGGGKKSISNDKANPPQFSSKKEELEYVRNQMVDFQTRYERLANEEEKPGQIGVLNKEKVQKA